MAGPEDQRQRRVSRWRLLSALAAAGLLVGWIGWRTAGPGTAPTSLGPLPRPEPPGADAAETVRHQDQPGPAPAVTAAAVAPSATSAEHPAANGASPIVTVTRPAAGRLAITVATAPPERVPAPDGACEIRVDGTLALAVRGQPPLPFVRREVLLAEGAEPVLDIAAEDWEVERCPPLRPSPGFVSRSDDERPRLPVAECAGSGAPFPTSPAWLTPVYRLSRLRGVGVILCPFRYDAATGTLATCRRLSVQVRGAADEADLARLSTASLAATADRWPDQLHHLPKSSPTPWPAGALLVLVPQSLAEAPALTSFLAWKHQRGMIVTLRTLPPQPGVATVRSAIRAFAEAVDNANVLLLGDENAIPPAQSANPPSDTLYAMLDGSGDRYHDLAIGRLAVTSPADLAVQLGRVEMYERWQWPAASTGAWCPNLTCIASNEDQGNLGLADWEAMERARTTLALGTDYEICEPLYDRGIQTPTKTDLARGWNSGRGLVLYLGHGLQQSWRTTGFTGGDVNLLLRYGPSLPFVLSAACHTGNFTLGSDCLCESLLKGGTASAPTGAIAAVGATSAMDWDPPVVMVQSFAAYVAQRSSFTAGGMAFDGGSPRTTAGELTFGAIQRAVDFCLATPAEGDAAARKIAEQTHLLGDPTLGFRTRPPVALAVQHAAAATCDAPFPVTVTSAGSGAAMKGVVVCLSTPESLWLATTTDTGLATVPVLRLTETTAMTLTAYAPNVIPYQAVVTIRPARVPVTVLTTDLPTGRRGEPYEASLQAAGGSGQGYLWTALSSLPDGLALVETGAIVGTPEGFGTWTLALRVEDRGDATGVAETVLELRLESPVFVPTASLPAATACAPYDAQITAAGSWPPFVFSWPDVSPDDGGRDLPIPAGLRLSPEGRLAGVAGSPGVVDLAVVVTDAAGNLCRTTLSLPVVAPSPDLDGLEGVDTAELLAFRVLVGEACATGDDWQAALARWQQDGRPTTPGLPGPILVGCLSAQRRMASSRYLPGGREVVRIELAGGDGLAPGTVAALTEVLPTGWTLADEAATDRAGRRVAGPRHDGQAVSWVLDEEALRGGVLTYTVRPSPPTAGPVVLQGWLALPEGVVATAGERLWWARSSREFRLPLRAGWNLVSWPLEVPDASLATALAGLDLRGCAASSMTPGRITSAAPLVAYWLWSPTPRTVLLEGYQAGSAETLLRAGWTACGVSGRRALADLPGNPVAAWGWDDNGWVPASGDLVPGRGYLVFRP